MSLPSPQVKCELTLSISSRQGHSHGLLCVRMRRRWSRPHGGRRMCHICHCDANTLSASLLSLQPCSLQPAAASCAERNWSIYGLIKSDRRTRTWPAVADKQMYCHEALALHAKLQDAGFSPEAEPSRPGMETQTQTQIRVRSRMRLMSCFA